MLVATKVLLQQTYLCCDKTFVATNICCHKHNFVTTKLLLWQAYFCGSKHANMSFVKAKIYCCDKHNFVMTKACLPRQKRCFVAPNMCLLWQKTCDKNDICGSSCHWYSKTTHTHTCLVCLQERGWQHLSASVFLTWCSPPHPTHTTTPHTPPPHTLTPCIHTPVLCACRKEVDSLYQHL